VTIKSSIFFTAFKLIVLAACLYYLGHCISVIRLEQLKSRYILTVLLTGSLYFACSFLPAQAWRLLVFFQRPEPLPFRDVAGIYFLAALAKYIPSNVMHFAARHVICKKYNISQKEILFSNILEVCLILVAAVILIISFVALNMASMPESVTADRHMLRRLTLIIGAVLLLIAGLIIYWQIKSVSSHRAHRTGRLAVIIGLYLTFLLLMGLVFYCQFMSMGLNLSFGFDTAIRFIFCYILSWTLGFITPGSPAGLGVREAVITSMLTAAIGSDLAVIGAVLFRLSSLLGEFLGYLYARLQLSLRA